MLQAVRPEAKPEQLMMMMMAVKDVHKNYRPMKKSMADYKLNVAVDDVYLWNVDVHSNIDFLHMNLTETMIMMMMIPLKR